MTGTEAVTSAGTTTTTRADVAAPAQVPGDVQQAVVRRIIDGDTLEVAAVATGPVLTSTGPVDVRLLEIDSPETNDPDRQAQCYGQEATAELTRLAPPGSTVWVQCDRELLDRYDRHLLYLWNAKGEFVNLSMVRSGHAAAVLYPPNDKHWATISSAESTARSASTGGWGTCPVFGRPAPEVTTPPPVPNPPPLPTHHPRRAHHRRSPRLCPTPNRLRPPRLPCSPGCRRNSWVPTPTAATIQGR